MSKSTICVVGCNGFVGSHIAAELLDQGYSVRACVRRPEELDWLKQALESYAERGATLALKATNPTDGPSLIKAMIGRSYETSV